MPEFKMPIADRINPSKRPVGMQDALLCWKAITGCIALWNTSQGAKAAVCWDDKTVVPGKLVYDAQNSCWAIRLDTKTSTKYDMHPLYDLEGEEI